MSLQLLDKPDESPLKESLIVLRGLTWEQFKNIAASFAELRSVKLSYLNGVLEIMSPISRRHERIKRTLSFLLEAYMRLKGIRFYSSGSYTLEREGYSSGEPDECYCIGSDKEIPDLVLEVIITSGSINRLDLYKPLQVAEVWFWKSNKLRVFRLEAGKYQEVTRSGFFPDLDLDLVRRYLDYKDQYDAVQEFQAAIEGTLKKED